MCRKIISLIITSVPDYKAQTVQSSPKFQSLIRYNLKQMGLQWGFNSLPVLFIAKFSMDVACDNVVFLATYVPFWDNSSDIPSKRIIMHWYQLLSYCKYLQTLETKV